MQEDEHQLIKSGFAHLVNTSFFWLMADLTDKLFIINKGNSNFCFIEKRSSFYTFPFYSFLITSLKRQHSGVLIPG